MFDVSDVRRLLVYVLGSGINGGYTKIYQKKTEAIYIYGIAVIIRKGVYFKRILIEYWICIQRVV